MNEITASMAGSVWKIHVKVGDSVAKGQEVITLESMKMEIPIVAEVAGTVTELRVGENDFVDEGNVLLIIE